MLISIDVPEEIQEEEAWRIVARGTV